VHLHHVCGKKKKVTTGRPEVRMGTFTRRGRFLARTERRVGVHSPACRWEKKKVESVRGGSPPLANFDAKASENGGGGNDPSRARHCADSKKKNEKEKNAW